VGWFIGADLAALTRLHIDYSGTAPTNATCALLASDLYTIFQGTLLPYTPSTTSLESVTVTDLTSPTAGHGEFLAHHVGTLSGVELGAGVAFLASMKIARRYRGGKPRSYLPLGSDNVLQTPQTWTSTFVANVQASLDAIRADIAVTTEAGCNLGQLVNVSYYAGFVSSQNPITLRWRNIPKPRITPVIDVATGWQAESRLSSQRRRNLRQS
jgi:hypothetical protein